MKPENHSMDVKNSELQNVADTVKSNGNGELYEEPPVLTGRDIFGIAFALLALTVIGFAGYVWLTPGMKFSDLIPQRTTASNKEPAQATLFIDRESAADTPAPGDEILQHDGSAAIVDEHPGHVMDDDSLRNQDNDGLEAIDEPSMSAAVIPAEHPHEQRCEYCGMFADRSLSHVIIGWSDGSHTHHDCWDCAFNHGRDNGLELVEAQVSLYQNTLEHPEWIDAMSATYLFDTSVEVQGSMPPFVAAFPDNASAEAAQDKLGGEVVDFDTLKGKWL